MLRRYWILLAIIAAILAFGPSAEPPPELAQVKPCEPAPATNR